MQSHGIHTLTVPIALKTAALMINSKLLTCTNRRPTIIMYDEEEAKNNVQARLHFLITCCVRRWLSVLLAREWMEIRKWPAHTNKLTKSNKRYTHTQPNNTEQHHIWYGILRPQQSARRACHTVALWIYWCNKLFSVVVFFLHFSNEHIQHQFKI